MFTWLGYQANKAGTKDNTETLTALLLMKIDPLLLRVDSIPAAPKATDSHQFSLYDSSYLPMQTELHLYEAIELAQLSWVQMFLQHTAC